MKSVIILGDGMSDEPQPDHGGRTPLMMAKKPSIDRIAREGCMGRLATIPDGLSPASDVGNLVVLGYDAAKLQNGRAVLEAASMGVDLAPDDVALRLNLISTTEGRIRDHSSGHITTEEAAAIVRDLDAAFGGAKGSLPVSFHPGVSYRHLLVLHGPWADPALECAGPHDHLGEAVADLLPRATSPAARAAEQRLREIVGATRGLLADHPVNRARRAAGKSVADSVWPWSPGRRPRMDTLQQRFGVKAAVISAVDLVMGLGVYAGMDVVRVPGATGLHDTNYEGKAQAVLDALANHDLVYVHVEATDEAGHARDLELKVKCIEYLDARLTRLILEGLAARGIAATVAVLPDHPTFVRTGKHGRDPVPFALWRPGITPDAATAFDESQAARGSFGLLQGDAFIRQVLGATA
jgi:2,3-bisphosphoglycerate-independent phosphoglycerate mutase